MNKRGTIVEIAYLVCIFLTMSMLFIIVAKVVDEIKNSDFVTSDDPIEQIDAENEWSKGLSATRFDRYFLGLIIGSYFGLMIISFALRTNPIFWIIGFFILIIDEILSFIASNVYSAFYSHSSISEISAGFVWQNHLMLNLPYYNAIFGFILMAILYGLSTYYEQ